MTENNKFIFFREKTIIWLSLINLLLLLFFLEIFLGSVKFPFDKVTLWLSGKEEIPEMWINIFLHIRLPRALAGIFSGAGLSLGGLLMQTLFRNPLAGPSVLGISSGASLGVALMMFLGTGGVLGAWVGFQFLGYGSLALVAILGAALVMLILIFASWKIQSNTALLLIGLMLGYFVSALVSLWQYFSEPEKIKEYLLWTFGSLAGVNLSQIPFLFMGVILGIALSFFLIKSLNALLLGEEYAYSMGVLVRQVRWQVILVVSLMVGVITAFCGPIGFIGIAVPHLARMLFNTQAHETLIPASLLLGASVLLFCDLIAKLPGYSIALPLNAITSLLGAPIVLLIIMRLQYGEKLFG